MISGRVFLAAAAALFIAMGSSEGLAQDATQAEDSYRLQLRLAPSVWLASVDATTTTGPMTFPLDFTLDDLFDRMEFAGALHGEIGKKRWTLIADGSYVRLKQTTTPVQSDVPDLPTVVNDSTSVDQTMNMTLVDILLAYRVGEHLGSLTPVNGKRGLQAFELYGGLRANFQQQDIQVLQGEPSLGREVDEYWVDPLIGVRFYADTGPRWGVLFRGDVGGFDVSSSTVWSVAGTVMWRVSDLVDLLAEYRYQDTDYANDEAGDAAYAFNGNVHGLLLGLNLNFGR